MNPDLYLDNFGRLEFKKGIPAPFSKYILPTASVYQASGSWGEVGFQEVKTAKFILRHFLFRLEKTLSFQNSERNEGLQSLLNLQGDIDYQVNGLKEINLSEKEFILFNAAAAETVTTIPGIKICSLVNTYYDPAAYEELLPLFPSLKKDLQKSIRKPYHFFFPTKIARYSVHDAINAMWFDRYHHILEKKHIELRLESTFFTLLAQTYTDSPFEPINAVEREKAIAAKEIILRNIRISPSLDEIAEELDCTVSFLKRAFSKLYGVGMYNYLRRTRMERAKEMLIQGASLKAVAIEVGMKPRNFPKEFKSFFGYTVTALKKGLT